MRLPDEEPQRLAIRRGYRWVTAMQGLTGMGAYDVDNNRIVFNYIPSPTIVPLGLDPAPPTWPVAVLKYFATFGLRLDPSLRWRRRSHS